MAFPQQTSEREHDPTSKDIGDIKSNDNDGNMEQLRSFAQDTTLHGARFLCADNIFRRLLWSVAVTVCFGHCCYQVFTCVSEFNKRPFNTKITVNTSKDNGVSFPAVTLCNLNSLNTRRFVDIMSVHENRSIIERKFFVANAQPIIQSSYKSYSAIKLKKCFYQEAQISSHARSMESPVT